MGVPLLFYPSPALVYSIFTFNSEIQNSRIQILDIDKTFGTTKGTMSNLYVVTVLSEHHVFNVRDGHFDLSSLWLKSHVYTCGIVDLFQ